jgi:hypothetical protein
MYIKPTNYYTMAGFDPGIFFSVGGRDDHYATPPVHFMQVIESQSNC